MWGPELEAAFVIAPQVEMVGSAGASFYSRDSDVFVDDEMTSYEASLGLRFSLN